MKPTYKQVLFKQPDMSYKRSEKASGYNQAIDEYEAFLPSEKEIRELVSKTFGEEASLQGIAQDKEVKEKGLWEADLKSWSFEEINKFIAKAISKRINPRR